mgnify:CR=1 FL=1
MAVQRTPGSGWANDGLGLAGVLRRCNLGRVTGHRGRQAANLCNSGHGADHRGCGLERWSRDGTGARTTQPVERGVGFQD